jgi:hypothetical protein
MPYITSEGRLQHGLVPTPKIVIKLLFSEEKNKLSWITGETIKHVCVLAPVQMQPVNVRKVGESFITLIETSE